MSSLPARRGDYGFDAPYAPLLMAGGGACLLALCVWRLWQGPGVAVTPYRISVVALGVAALWSFLDAGIFVHTARMGKFAVWAELLDRLELRGDEHLLDPAGALRSRPAGDPLDDRRVLMINLDFRGRGRLPGSAAEGLARIDANPGLRDELRELLAYRLGRIDSVATRPDLPLSCPLSLHAPDTRDAVLAALGHWTRDRQRAMREGVLHLPEIRADAFFVTLHETEAHFSPTTMYRDYAVNERLFHWQTQSTTSADSPTGRRYVEHESRGHSILLFVREHRGRHGLSEPFLFLGPARYAGHTGSRPMSITWQLVHPLPARLYRQLARLAVA